ncbi:MAG: hypothetical protein LAT50_16440 [Ectothiorhodospiraceae bacterium]|nr:hypothetical protein [Ectothiorhodospiraceae bacterium]
MQCDELWSFVDHKGNKQWVWLALDAETREIIGAYIVLALPKVRKNSGIPYPTSIGNVL